MTKLTLVTVDPKANLKKEVVEMAEYLLEEAKAGRLVDLAYATMSIDGYAKTGYTTTSNAHERLAAVSRLLHRLHINADDNGGEDN